MSFGEMLKKLRESKNMSQATLASNIGLKNGNAVSNYETGVSKPHLDKFIDICKLFKISPNKLLEEELSDIVYSDIPLEIQKIFDKYKNLSTHDREIVDYIFNIQKETEIVVKHTVIYRLPVYNQDVAAGSGQLGFDQKHHIEEFYVDDISKDVSYGIHIIGDSMTTDDEKSIPNGSTVFVTTNFNPSDLEKEAVIVNLNGVLVCKEYSISDDGHLWLKSRNRKKANEDKHIYNLSDVKIIGRVIKVIK